MSDLLTTIAAKTTLETAKKMTAIGFKNVDEIASLVEYLFRSTRKSFMLILFLTSICTMLSLSIYDFSVKPISLKPMFTFKTVFILMPKIDPLIPQININELEKWTQTYGYYLNATKASELSTTLNKLDEKNIPAVELMVNNSNNCIELELISDDYNEGFILHNDITSDVEENLQVFLPPNITLTRSNLIYSKSYPFVYILFKIFIYILFILLAFTVLYNILFNYSRKIRNFRQASEVLPYRCIGTVERYKPRKKKNAEILALITLTNKNHNVAIQLQVICSFIINEYYQSEIKTISIISSFPNQGKSSILSNIAIVLSNAQYKVCLVDVDLRNPSIHKFFGLNNSVGLTNYLVMHCDLSEIIKTYSIETKSSLSIITTGPIPPNKFELLCSSSFLDCIDELRKQFDFVLIDGPPGLFADSLMISSKVDGCLVVIPEFSEIGDALNICNNIESSHGNIIGTIINNSSPISPLPFYFYYYYYSP